MTKIYQSLTSPVRHHITITDTRMTRNNQISYGIKHELKQWYVYMKKEGSPLGWRKVHGPFRSNHDAEQMIFGIQIELAKICSDYHKMKDERDANSINKKD